MRDLKTWISVSVEKELPKEYDKYHCFLHSGAKVTAYYKKYWIINFDEVITKSVKSYLREFSLPELMEEQTNEYNTRVANGTMQGLTLKEFINDFLTQKGIV